MRTLALALCLLVTPAWAWEIKTTGPVTITGTGEFPAVTPGGRLPPPTPPLPPPPVVPPVVDSRPFSFPVQQPGQDNSGEARYYNLCAGAGGCYAGLPQYNNPLRGSHLLACITPLGMVQGAASIGGMRLYVPADLPPGQIRTLCAGGAL